MEKAVLILFILAFLPIVSSAEIILQKESYQPQETLQAEIDANFINPLQSENIYLYRDRSIPIMYDIFKHENKYLLYVILPAQEGSYSIQIKNAEYSLGAQTSTEPIIKNFEIRKTNETALQINPGFISTDKDFSIKIKNLAKTTQITAELEATSEKKEFNLAEYQEKKIYFSVKDIEEFTKTNLKINDYNIPVFIYAETQDPKIDYVQRKLRFNPNEIQTNITSKTNFLFEIYLENLGNEKITEISLSSDSDIEIEPEFISELLEQEKISINLTVNSKKDFKTNLSASSQNYSIILPVDIHITEDIEDIDYHSPSTELQTCAEVGGFFCNASLKETCDAKLTSKKDGLCCIGKCVVEESGSLWIWGVLIFLVLGIGAGIFFWKMKKKQKKQTSPKKELKQRTEKFEKRMSPHPYPEPPEVIRRLTKV